MARQPADKSSKNDDSALIRELALLLDETSLTEIEIERAGLRVRVARNISVAASLPQAYVSAAAAAPAPVTAAAPAAASLFIVGSSIGEARWVAYAGPPRLWTINGLSPSRRRFCRARHATPLASPRRLALRYFADQADVVALAVR